jgi:nucleoside-diphosphate-sugar epimerase
MADVRPVLVTGGAGFAGSYVVRGLLDGGDRVVVYDLADYRDESRFVIGDHIEDVVTERGSIDNWPAVVAAVERYRPRAIAHLAGIMDVGLLDRNPLLALKVNVEGTCNVLEAARLYGVERVVVFSTIGVHGRKVYEPIDGDHPTVTARDGPLGAYSAAKLACEAFAYAYNQAFGLDIRIVRPSALYGFGMSWFAPNYVKNIVEPAVLGEPVRLLAGGQVPRDYAHAADLASLVSAVLAGPEDADRVFYAATGRPLRTGGHVAEIVRALVPGAIVEVADEWTDSDTAELRFRGQISIDNGREQLGWNPSFVELERGIEDYIDRFRAYLAAGGVPTPRPALRGAPGA